MSKCKEVNSRSVSEDSGNIGNSAATLRVLGRSAKQIS